MSPPCAACWARAPAPTGHRPIAAAFGAVDELPALLKSAVPDEAQRALGLAVINRQTEAARLALDAGADPNGFLPVHTHSLPLHMAVLLEDLPTMELLVAPGARTDVPDKLWGSTPLGWAVHENKPRAREWLEKNSPPHSDGEEC